METPETKPNDRSAPQPKQTAKQPDPETFSVPFTLTYKGTTLLPGDVYTVVRSGVDVDDTSKTIHYRTKEAIEKRLKDVTTDRRRRVEL